MRVDSLGCGAPDLVVDCEERYETVETTHENSPNVTFSIAYAKASTHILIIRFSEIGDV